MISRKGMVALLVLCLSGCASYSDSQQRERKTDISAVSCDSTPANQPGCYRPYKSSWSFSDLKFTLGN
ncbi:hypothetical protein [Pseudomonas chlororaphis]|uniref:Lipoprotein n=1 Tax=Pseudomonas chlororaphis TaxID=587753 RepID=A0A1Q8ENL2_9PSED|nr:hypothetical protein [Pseudomonas chlororaphis]OLF53397.1 hypothetical protein BTN82_16665 [Pseudomonas chlororaphis]